MNGWYFPSRGHAETEGFSNAGLAEFRGNPLQALAREICQNSLDAADGSGRAVRVEFHRDFIDIKRFPGMNQMQKIIQACDEFWGKEGDANTKNFLQKAKTLSGVLDSLGPKEKMPKCFITSFEQIIKRSLKKPSHFINWEF